jgi:hypothetical protein
VGGQSGGKKALRTESEWVREQRDFAVAAGAAFFFKQWGVWEHNPIGKEAELKLNPGAKHGGAIFGWAPVAGVSCRLMQAERRLSVAACRSK